MLEIIFFSFIAAAIVVYVIPRGGCNIGPISRPMTEKEKKMSVLDDLVSNQISYINRITSLDYYQGRRISPKLEKPKLKERVKAEIYGYATNDCHMTDEQLDTYLDKRIKYCTGK